MALLAVLIIVVFWCILIGTFDWQVWIVAPNRFLVYGGSLGRDARTRLNGSFRMKSVYRYAGRYGQSRRVQLLVVSRAGEQVLAERSRWSYGTVRGLEEHLAAVTGWELDDPVASALPREMGL